MWFSERWHHIANSLQWETSSLLTGNHHQVWPACSSEECSSHGCFAISLEPSNGTGSYAINALEPKIHQWQASRQPSTPTKLTIFALQVVLTSVQQQLSAIEDKHSERMESEHSLPAGNMPMRPSAFITRRCVNWMPQIALASCPDVSTQSTPNPTNICQLSNRKVIVPISGPHWKLAHKGYIAVILTVQCTRRAYTYTVEIQ
jgi:hypothetical protein